MRRRMIVLRHAESKWNIKKNAYALGKLEKLEVLPSSSDASLTPSGKIQAILTSGYLRRNYGPINFAAFSQTYRASETGFLALPRLADQTVNWNYRQYPGLEEVLDKGVIRRLKAGRDSFLAGAYDHGIGPILRAYDIFTQTVRVGGVCPAPFYFRPNFIAFVLFAKQHEAECNKMLREKAWSPGPEFSAYIRQVRDEIDREWKKHVDEHEDLGLLDCLIPNSLTLDFEDGMLLNIVKVDGDYELSVREDWSHVGVKRILEAYARRVPIEGGIYLAVLHAKRIVRLRQEVEGLSEEETQRLLKAKDTDFPQNCSLIEYEITDGIWKRVGEPHCLPDDLIYLGDRRVGFRLPPAELAALCARENIPYAEVADLVRWSWRD